MNWTFLPAAASFAELRTEWDCVNASQSNHLLLHSDFVEPLLRYFGGPEIVLSIRRHCRPALALLRRNRTGIWSSFQPSQAPVGMILFERDNAGEQIRDLLRCVPGCALQLSVLHQDPDYSAWPRSAAASDLEAVDYIDTARITIGTTFEEYWKTRSSNLRHNISRQQRRLLEAGRRLELLVRTGADDVAASIVAHSRLELEGWKSQTGTAIGAENVQGFFYTEMLERFSCRNETLIFQLLLDGKVIASELCLKRDGILIILKTAYDEAQKSLSPGLLLQYYQLQWAFDCQSIRVIEFYGRVMDWHRKFTDEIRTMYHLNCYRYGWLPIMRQFVRRWQ